MKRTRIARFAVLVGVAVLVTATGASGATEGDSSESSSPAAGGCSKAEASAVVRRLRLGEPSLGYPVADVLCGAFTGARSQTMVVTLAGPTGPLDWVVFRWAEGAWQLLMRQGAGASITAAGSDIRQTVSILRDGDSRCCPSGGTKTRIWHWNGTRFSHSAWKYSTPSSQRSPTPAKLFYFESPSHNIWCDSGDEGQAYCATRTPPRSVTLKADGTLTICASRRCSGPARFGGDPVLGYGQFNEQGGYRCQSKLAGMSCTVMLPGKEFGKGFLINRDGVSRLGS